MIEKASAVEQLDEILAVPGVDMVQWGPADYSMSIGRSGEWNHPTSGAWSATSSSAASRPVSRRAPS